MFKKIWLTGLTLGICSLSLAVPNAHAANNSCTQVGATKTVAGSTFICANIFGKKNWVKKPAGSKVNTASYISPSAATQTRKSGPCTGSIPEGYNFTADAKGTNAEAVSSDGKTHFGYGLFPVDTALAPYASVYGMEPDFYSSNPGTQAIALMKVANKDYGYATNISLVGNQENNGVYHASKFQTSNSVGYLVWANPGFQATASTYIAAIRFSEAPAGTNETELLRMLRNALEIRCTAQVSPPSAFSSSSSTSSSKTPPKSKDEYNMQLGSFEGHDASGKNYTVTMADITQTGCNTGNAVAITRGPNGCMEIMPGRAGD